MYHTDQTYDKIALGKNFVSLILGSPKGIDKCKRKLQFAEDGKQQKPDDNTRQRQKTRGKKRKLLKVSTQIYSHRLYTSMN